MILIQMIPARAMTNPNFKTLRPKDSACLIILRNNMGKTQMLMGKRHPNHVFMPNVYVFPGGKVDLADCKLKTSQQISYKTQQQLLSSMKGRASIARANGLVLAAIRETFEETGYVIGQAVKSPPKTKAASWRDFYNTGHIPYVEKCKFIARAITPPQNIRRYDTRFFAIWQHDIPNGMLQEGQGSDELEELLWVDVHDIGSINMHVITTMIVNELKKHIANQKFIDNCPIAFYYFHKKRMQRDEIS